MVKAGIDQREVVALGVEISRSDDAFVVVAPAWSGPVQVACRGVKPSLQAVTDSESHGVRDGTRMKGIGRGKTQQRNTLNMDMSDLYSASTEKP